MAREVLYRRSFHLDRDLKGMESLFELDRAFVTRKSSTEMRSLAADGGFEAPRNSLDVPFCGLLEARRNSEVRCEEIPVGYELSRSLTTRRAKEDYSNLKPLPSTSDQGIMKGKGNGAKMNLELDSKPQPRAPSVVARLMGLDALPRQEALQGSHHSSLRRVSLECPSSDDLPTGNQVNVSSRSAEYEAPVTDYGKEKVGYGELSFRIHPQEKQLQEFKKEFVARQALHVRPSLSSLNPESLSLPLQKREENRHLHPEMDSEEFLDALDFLNANKDFFVKILNDPHSSFAKHLQQGGGSLPSIEDGSKHHEGGKLTKRSFECNVDSSTVVSGEWKKRPDMYQTGAVDKAKAIGNLRWGRDDEMPARVHWRTRGGSTMKSSGRVGGSQAIPTRIVVLKPNLGRQPIEKGSSPSSPLLRPDGVMNFKTEGKGYVNQDIRLRTNVRNDGGQARDFLVDDLKDGPYDARAIAKQIVKHVKEDMSQRSFKDGMRILDSYGRNLSAQRVGAYPNDGNGMVVDGEVYQRATREAGRFSSSLPSSPRLSKVDRGTEHRQLSFNGKGGCHLEESKKTSYKQQPPSPAKSFKESSKVDTNIMQGNQCLGKKECNGKESKALKKTCRSNSLKVRDIKCEVPRVLPRSLSAPAAPCVENRALENESRGACSIERATCSSRAKSSENSVFKERLLSLKDSFSLSKRRGGRKLGPPAECSLPLDLVELPTPRPLDIKPTNSNEVYNSQTRLPWQAVPSLTKEDAKEDVEEPFSEILFDSSLKTSELPQWTPLADLADTASETSLDKCEQPSPISVLEMPFQEESPSSEDSREKESKCHDFNGGLSHLETNQRVRNLHAVFFSQPSSRHSSFDSSLDESLDTWSLLEAQLESVGMCGVACPSGSEAEFTYIMHVLSLAGLTVNGLVMAHSLSSEYGVNQSIFGRLEAYYDKKGDQAPLNSTSRRLLFDVVNEVITSMRKKRLLQPWKMSNNQRVLICTNKQLLEQIFTHTNYHCSIPFGVEEEALEDMASKDLMRDAPWVHSQSDIESVVMELERLLCGDIIRELVHDIKS